MVRVEQFVRQQLDRGWLAEYNRVAQPSEAEAATILDGREQDEALLNVFAVLLGMHPTQLSRTQILTNRSTVSEHMVRHPGGHAASAKELEVCEREFAAHSEDVQGASGHPFMEFVRTWVGRSLAKGHAVAARTAADDAATGSEPDADAAAAPKAHTATVSTPAAAATTSDNTSDSDVYEGPTFDNVPQPTQEEAASLLKSTPCVSWLGLFALLLGKKPTLSTLKGILADRPAVTAALLTARSKPVPSVKLLHTADKVLGFSPPPLPATEHPFVLRAAAYVRHQLMRGWLAVYDAARKPTSEEAHSLLEDKATVGMLGVLALLIGLPTSAESLKTIMFYHSTVRSMLEAEGCHPDVSASTVAAADRVLGASPTTLPADAHPYMRFIELWVRRGVSLGRAQQANAKGADAKGADAEAEAEAEPSKPEEAPQDQGSSVAKQPAPPSFEGVPHPTAAESAKLLQNQAHVTWLGMFAVLLGKKPSRTSLQTILSDRHAVDAAVAAANGQPAVGDKVLRTADKVLGLVPPALASDAHDFLVRVRQYVEFALLRGWLKAFDAVPQPSSDEAHALLEDKRNIALLGMFAMLVGLPPSGSSLQVMLFYRANVRSRLQEGGCHPNVTRQTVRTADRVLGKEPEALPETAHPFMLFVQRWVHRGVAIGRARAAAGVAASAEAAMRSQQEQDKMAAASKGANDGAAAEPHLNVDAQAEAAQLAMRQYAADEAKLSGPIPPCSDADCAELLKRAMTRAVFVVFAKLLGLTAVDDAALTSLAVSQQAIRDHLEGSSAGTAASLSVLEFADRTLGSNPPADDPSAHPFAAYVFAWVRRALVAGCNAHQFRFTPEHRVVSGGGSEVLVSLRAGADGAVYVHAVTTDRAAHGELLLPPSTASALGLQGAPQRVLHGFALTRVRVEHPGAAGDTLSVELSDRKALGSLVTLVRGAYRLSSAPRRTASAEADAGAGAGSGAGAGAGAGADAGAGAGAGAGGVDATESSTTLHGELFPKQADLDNVLKSKNDMSLVGVVSFQCAPLCEQRRSFLLWGCCNLCCFTVSLWLQMCMILGYKPTVKSVQRLLADPGSLEQAMSSVDPAQLPVLCCWQCERPRKGERERTAQALTLWVLCLFGRLMW